MKIGVIGGGAAGFMAAISAKTTNPDSEVCILEKSGKLLSKVKVSGGGRCNVTNGIKSPAEFAKNYPRGSKFIKKAFSQFSQADTIKWFESKGVVLKIEPDGRMFPTTDDSQTIIDCLVRQCRIHKIAIMKNCPVKQIQIVDEKFICSDDEQVYYFDKVIITTGGNPKLSGFDWLSDLGIKIVPPVPSLFTFNLPKNPITKLQGLSTKHSAIKIQGTKFKSEGPVLITHWGLSGPAVLKLSAWSARELNGFDYQFNISINWLNETEQNIKEQFQISSNKRLINHCPFDLPQRLWEYTLQKSGIPNDKTWNETGKKDFNKLCELLMNDIYQVSGKTTFKEEFVTCGGVDLQEIDANTMECKNLRGLYFAGEVMDIDGITGGFNFQSAWTTGFIAGKSAGSKKIGRR